MLGHHQELSDGCAELRTNWLRCRTSAGGSSIALQFLITRTRPWPELASLGSSRDPSGTWEPGGFRRSRCGGLASCTAVWLAGAAMPAGPQVSFDLVPRTSTTAGPAAAAASSAPTAALDDTQAVKCPLHVVLLLAAATVACAALGFFLFQPAAKPVPNPVVSTSLGAYRGSQSAAGDVDMFLGVPYAAPPLGQHRFMPARPPPDLLRRAPYDATRYRGPCVQVC